LIPLSPNFPQILALNNRPDRQFTQSIVIHYQNFQIPTIPQSTNRPQINITRLKSLQIPEFLEKFVGNMRHGCIAEIHMEYQRIIVINQMRAGNCDFFVDIIDKKVIYCASITISRVDRKNAIRNFVGF
jgi:hypothetical protein